MYCPGANLCVAVDTVTNVDGSYVLHAVSYPSSLLCIAVEDYDDVVTSTNPTAGASAWKATNVYVSGLSGVSSARSDLCVTLSRGMVVTSNNPGAAAPAWVFPALGADGLNVLQGVSCPSSSFRVAVDQAGNAVISSGGEGLVGDPYRQRQQCRLWPGWRFLSRH